MFLGANDPWDMPNPKGGSYLKFQSPEWETVYRSRISQIIQTAKENRISVMWLSPPNMKKDSLNQQMVYLNRVISDEVKKHQAFLLIPDHYSVEKTIFTMNMLLKMEILLKCVVLMESIFQQMVRN